MKTIRALLISAVLLAALPASASAHSKLRCHSGYARHSVRVKERRHGRVVRRRGHVIWVRVERCVRVKPKSPPKVSAPKVPTFFSTHVDPTFTQSPSNPLAVTYAYNASAFAGQVDLGAQGQLPDGILDFYSPTAPGQPAGLVCSMNVGGAMTGGACPIAYAATGTYQVTTEYIPNGASAVSQTDTETISPYATAITEQASTLNSYNSSWPYGVVITPQVTDQNGNALAPSGGEITVTVTDLTSGASATYTGSGTLTLAEYANGSQAQLASADHKFSGPLLAINENNTDTLQIVASYLGSPGYSGSSSAAAQVG